MYRIDLHTHSKHSDGTLTPEELVRHARECRCKAIALTDHDTVAGVPAAMKEGALQDVEVLPGIEFSTEYKGHDIHIVGIEINMEDPVFLAAIASFQKERDRRNERMIAKMEDAGLPISMEIMQNTFGDTIWTRANFARYFLDNGLASSMQDAFDRYIGDDAPFFEPKFKIPAENAVDLIRRNGGIPILAHPFSYGMEFSEIRELVRLLKSHGLIGVESQYSTHSGQQTQAIAQLVREFGLTVSGGSDFHGSNKPAIELAVGKGNLDISYDVLTNLRRKRDDYRKKHRKLLFTDLDGTLLTRTKELSEGNRIAIQRACNAGHSVILSSGRPLYSIKKLVETLGLTGPNNYCIAYNGGLLYDVYHDQILKKTTLPFSFVRFLFDFAHERNVHVQTYSATNVITEIDHPFIHTYSANTKVPYKVVGDILEELTEEPCKILLIDYNDHNRLEQVKAELEPLVSNTADLIFSDKALLEITPKNVSKGNAVRDLVKILSVPMENTVCAGDEENDRSLFETVHTGCAMANAVPSIKAIAGYVTEHDCDHDGVAEIIEKFILD